MCQRVPGFGVPGSCLKTPFPDMGDTGLTTHAEPIARLLPRARAQQRRQDRFQLGTAGAVTLAIQNCKQASLDAGRQDCSGVLQVGSSSSSSG